MATSVLDDDDDDLRQPFFNLTIRSEEETGMEPEHLSEEFLQEEYISMEVEPPNIRNGELKEIEFTDVVTPEVGMKFEDVEKMYEVFRLYGCHKGFSVRRRHSKKGDDRKLRYVALECSRGNKLWQSKGLNVLRPRPQGGIGCKVRLSARLNIDGEWEITKLVLDHNHDLCPSKTRFYRCNRKLTPSMKRKLVLHDIVGVRPNKSINTIVVESGGYENMGYAGNCFYFFCCLMLLTSCLYFLIT
ncbi:protein FAR1-RELATED SEQUENCE 5-like [Iris pallida]|uniref:Protein FAR1-RELATED SEQUENCE 5-like n=1 Tax=Iris pallida TaxID=29817 RepID=A0AAX6GNT0_IRIPA|nr:protein FAR1-RELATED SEQUENCE 5-like [Iris pallida]